MLNRKTLSTLLLALAAVQYLSAANAAVLVADRLGTRVVAYSDSGQFSHVVATGIGSGASSGPSGGMAISPNGQYLYAAGITALHRFDWNPTTLTASNRVQISGAVGTGSVASPAGLVFDADTLFVGNRGGTTVARLNIDGTGQDTNLSGGGTGGRSALAFASNGQLLVGNFSNGAIHSYDTATGFISNLVAPSASGGPLTSIASMLAVGNSLYAVSGGGGKFAKFDINTGALDTSFGVNGLITTDASIGNAPLSWPSALSLAPGGNGILVGILTGTNGAGYINQYEFDGDFVSRWATNSSANLPAGFGEPTGLLYLVPEPSALALAFIGIVAFGLRSRRPKA